MKYRNKANGTVIESNSKITGTLWEPVKQAKPRKAKAEQAEAGKVTEGQKTEG